MAVRSGSPAVTTRAATSSGPDPHGPPVTPHRLRPVPALDGLRALAVAAVVLFHYPTHQVFVGGLFGVGVFFVLSGFLVTAGLFDEADATATVRVGRFVSRRAWRLLPALVLLLAVFLGLAVAFRDSAWFASNPFTALPHAPGRPIHLETAATRVGAALSYWFNYVLALHWRSPSPLGHLWTLSVEGQFYLGVVLVVWAALRLRRRHLLGPLALALIAGSALLPFLVWHHGTAQDAIYFGTGPRIQQLVGGAALAGAWRRGWFDRVAPSRLRLLALAGTGALLWLLFGVGNVEFKYLGAFTVTAAAAGTIVAFLLRAPSGAWSARVLSHPVLTWIGRRSYGIYLWHWPLAEWTNRLPHAWGVPLGIGLSVGMAEISWRLVEQPARRWQRRRSSRRADAGTAGERTAASRRAGDHSGAALGIAGPVGIAGAVGSSHPGAPAVPARASGPLRRATRAHQPGV